MNVPDAEARRWWDQACEDIAVVRTLHAAGHHAASCFHAQQTAEKALKSVLYSQGQRLVLGHSVLELARQCETIDPAFSAASAAGVLLDPFYIPTRYPNGLPTPAVPGRFYDVGQSQLAMDAAERVLRAAETFLRSRTQALKS